ncbi:MAG: hypothetical protein NPIRA03_30160 [Nitrospirales bacterium]|nr:MAG: hypothetical protein NPIRA03_30160 [Nitrospirales bacterium]
MFSDKRFAEAGEQGDRLLSLTKPAGTIALDLCCDPGRCAIALANRGFSVTGIDRTKFLLDEPQENAQSAQVKICWVEQDRRDFVRPGEFAFVLNRLTSFGYFQNTHDDLSVLENMFAPL